MNFVFNSFLMQNFLIVYYLNVCSLFCSKSLFLSTNIFRLNIIEFFSINLILLLFVSTFYFLLPKVEKVLFWGLIFEVEILMDLHVLSPLNPKVLALGLCVCVFVYVCVCVTVISLTQKQMTSETSNLAVVVGCRLKANCPHVGPEPIKFGTLHLYHVQMLRKTFYKDRSKTLFTDMHKRILKHYGLWTEFRVSEFSYI